MPRKVTWNYDDLQRAIEECSYGNVAKRDVARKYNIPWTTLQNKLTGKRPVTHDDFKQTTVLSTAQERDIVEWLKSMAKRGFGRSKQDFLVTVGKYVDYHGIKTPWKDNIPGDMWYRLFRKRWPELVFRKTQKLGQARAQLTEEMLKQWFDNMTSIIQDIDPTILLDPSRIFNADESGFQLDAQSGRIITDLQHRYVYQVSQETHTMITVLVCCNAAGYFVNPMLIYPPTHFKNFDKSDIFEESFTTKSPNGWIDKAIFIKWLERVFIPQTEHLKKPIVLYMDGHVSHISLEASTMCRDNGVVLYGLLAHASHIIQPLDVGVFKSLKASWREAVRQRSERIITKKSFGGTFKTAYQSVVKDSTIVYQAFKKCGLFPLDYNAIDKSKLVSVAPTTTSNQSPNELQLTVSETASLPSLSHQENNASDLTTRSPVSNTTPTTSGCSSSPVPVLPQTLVELMDFVANIGESTLDLYKTRFEEGYDIPDEQYDKWKKLVKECSIPHAETTVPTTEIKRTSADPLKIPSIPTGKKQKKKPMPNFMSGPDFIRELTNKELEKAAEEKRKEDRKIMLAEKALKRKKDEEDKLERKRKREEAKSTREKAKASTSKTSRKSKPYPKTQKKEMDTNNPDSEEDEEEGRLKHAQEEAIIKARKMMASLAEKDRQDQQAESKISSSDKTNDQDVSLDLDLGPGLDSILDELNKALMNETDLL